jgi:hypothetical protein
MRIGLFLAASVLIGSCAANKASHDAAIYTQDIRMMGHDPALEATARELGWSVTYDGELTTLRPRERASFADAMRLLKLAQVRGLRVGIISEPNPEP